MLLRRLVKVGDEVDTVAIRRGPAWDQSSSLFFFSGGLGCYICLSLLAGGGM